VAAGWISTGCAARDRLVAAAVFLLAFAATACGGEGDLARIPLGGSGSARQASADATSMAVLDPRTFVLADGVDLPAADAEAWRWDGPLEEDVAALAGRLGVTGSPMELPPDQGGGWLVEDRPTGQSLSVASSGAWSGSGGQTSTVVSSTCDGRVAVSIAPAAPDGGPVATTVDDSSACEGVVTAPPSSLPTDDEVLATATAVLGGGVTAGVDWRDEWSVSVSVEYLVDGQPSGQLGYYATYGSGWYASGMLGTPVGQGRYPTISAADAVSRLTDSPLSLGLVRGAGDAATSAVLRNDVAESPPTEPVAEPAPMVEPMPTVEPMPVPERISEPLPEPLPEPEPTEILLVGVAATLVPFFDGTGAVWSLPGYVFTDADGGEWEVVAVSDEYFDEPAQAPDDVAVDPPFDGDEPVTGGGSDGIVEPSPGDGWSGVSEPDPGETLPDVVGLAEVDATTALGDAGFTVRVVERDGEAFMATKDYRTDRANLVVDGGVVTSVTIG